MIKHFCDCCGEEYEPHPGVALERRLHTNEFRDVVVKVTVTPSEAEVCDGCVVRALCDG